MARRKSLFQQVNEIVNKRKVLEKTAHEVARRATAISRENGGTATYTVRTGIRPGGRAYADVVSSSPEEEHGTEDTPRINALRRAGRGERGGSVR